LSLDFSKLNSIQRKSSTKEDQPQHAEGNACIEAERAQNVAELKRRDKYHDAIRVSEQLRIEITKGVQSGEPLNVLFLKACKAISLITGDRCFYDQINEIINK
jgi:uncharacterized membrane protein YqiK